MRKSLRNLGFLKFRVPLRCLAACCEEIHLEYMIKHLKIFCFAFLIAIGPPALMAEETAPLSGLQKDSSLTNAVVNIFVTTNQMDSFRPCHSKGIKSIVGSGTIIKGNRILPHLHVVSTHTFIHV